MNAPYLDSDETYFNITQVAKLIGVVPATIRNWEKQNLFVSKRASNGYRIFSMSDIDVLRQIRSMSDQGMTMNAIRSMSYPNILTVNKRANPIIPKSLIGQKWRQYRLSHGYSIEQVANETGISSSYIHKIENAQTKNVSFDILQKLASFYGENILSYYEQHSSAISPMVKRGTGDVLSINLPGVTLHSLTRCADNHLTAMIYTIEPGGGRFEANRHNGEEIIYIISGSLKFILNGEAYMLSQGDSLHFKSHISHEWHNPGKEVTQMLWVYTPDNTSAES